MAIIREDLRAFLVKLLRLSEARRIRWSDTPDEDTFRTVLKEGAVLVERMHSGPDVSLHRAVVLNGNDQPIAEFQSSDRQEEDMLENLFNAARDTALKSEDVFRNLVMELERLGK